MTFEVIELNPCYRLQMKEADVSGEEDSGYWMIEKTLRLGVLMKVFGAALVAGAVILSCSPGTAQTLDDQAKCAALARAAFKEIETHTRPDMLKYGNTDINSTFASYLNTGLHRCFVMIERSFIDINRKMSTQVDLTDAISRHGYAFWSDTGGAMLTCDLSPPGKPGSSDSGPIREPIVNLFSNVSKTEQCADIAARHDGPITAPVTASTGD